MKRTPALLLLLLATVSPTEVLSAPYEWTISTSSTDPFVHDAPATGTVATYYLWYSCRNPSVVDGMSAATFAVETTGSVFHVATVTQNGFVNTGTVSDLQLVVSGCPTGPVVAAELVVFAFPGAVGLAAAPGQPEPVTTDCEPVGNAWPIDWKGVGVGGETPPGEGFVQDCGLIGHCPVILCDANGECYDIDCWPDCECEFPNEVGSCEQCEPTPVQSNTWGKAKSYYR